MSVAGDYLLMQATRLVQHCEHTQSLLRTVLEWADQGSYDPATDSHSFRLPGSTVRAIRLALEPTDEGYRPGP